jgi:hypothetical protein
MTAVIKGKWVGLFIEVVFILQLNDGKQSGLKSWMRLVHAWRVDNEMIDVIFNF